MTDLHRYQYLALDPGQTTGWARLDLGEFIAGEYPCDEAIEMADNTVYAERILAARPMVVAVERANINSNKGGRGILHSLSWEMETIGCLKYFARQTESTFQQYNRSDALAIASDELLKKLGWWFVGGDGHANDAARILVCAVRQYDLDYWKRVVIDKGILI